MNNKSKATVISIINMKGGVGKTTLTINIASHLANKGKSVLVIDMDPQFNSTQSLIQYKIANQSPAGTTATDDSSSDTSESQQPTIVKNSADFYTVLSDENKTINSLFQQKQVLKSEDLIIPIVENIDLIPGDLNLTFANQGDTDPKNHVIQEFFDQANLLNEYNYILIDNSPTWTPVLTLSSLHASNFYLIPTKLEFYSALGIRLLKDQLYKYQSRKYDKLEIAPLGIVPMFTTNIKAENLVLDTLTKEFKDIGVFSNSIPSTPSAGSKFTLYDEVSGHTRYDALNNSFDKFFIEFQNKLDHENN
ncbi:ParA family protein [Weissella viridescens]|uniref:ParA family protein n=1 Tax=Weissella viridescens TaxID=1629 RepID=UPI0022DF4881|nr:ParA family protein [Weissella viridescens]